MTEWKRYTHPYLGDGIVDLLGAESCLCGLPKANQIHKIKPTDPDVKDAESRRIGERNRRD